MMKAIAVCVAVAVLTGCATLVDPAQEKSIAGKWEMTLPAGFKHPATLVALGDQRFRIEDTPPNFRGVYERTGDRLAVVEPTDKRLTEFVWQIQSDDSLLLIESPPTGKIGSDYRGATLKRKDL